jgi:hypothetical protein
MSLKVLRDSGANRRAGSAIFPDPLERGYFYPVNEVTLKLDMGRKEGSALAALYAIECKRYYPRR